MGWNSNRAASSGSSAPWAAQQPYLKRAFSEAEKLYETGGPVPWQGPTVAGWGAQTKQARAALENFWNTSDAASQATEARRFGLQGVLNPESNKALQSAISGAIRPTTQALTEDILPSIASKSLLEGGYGGTRQGIAEGLAISRANQQNLDTAARMQSDAYNRGLGTFESTVGNLPYLVSQEQRPITDLAALGAQEDELRQALLTDEINRYWQNQLRPYQNLEQFLNFISGAYGGTSDTYGNVRTGFAEGGGLLGQLGRILGI